MKYASIVLILSFFMFNTLISYAHEMQPIKAAEEAINQGLKIPASDPDGRVQTLNKKGAMSPDLDQISKEFITFAATPYAKVLEIGAGYGLACIKALEMGAKDYTVNDLDPRHLKLLARHVKELNKAYLSNIHLFSGAFPGEVILPNQQFDAILIARVLHFMNPAEISVVLSECYKILKPGGRIYAVMLSPYVQGYASFIPEFERRVQNNEPFPGYVENLMEIADKNIIPENALKNMEKQFLFFDMRTARSCFENNGFIVEKVIEMPLAYSSKIWQLDGRENIGIIAVKPYE